MMDNSLALLEDINRIECRRTVFWVKDQNGEVPNLLKSIETIPEYCLDTICLTEEEKTTLNKSLPIKQAIETFASMGFKNFFIYEVMGENYYPDIDLKSTNIRPSPTFTQHRSEDYSKMTDEELKNWIIAAKKINKDKG